MIMKTFTGRTVDLQNFKVEDIDLRDIAISLSRQNRYLGHTAVEWSVGKHMILCGMIAKLVGLSDEFVKAIFIHDVHETWYQDIISPIKHTYLGGEYENYSEDTYQADVIIYDFFGLAKFLADNDKTAVVKKIDTVAYVIEQLELRPGYVYEEDKPNLSPEVDRMVKFLLGSDFHIDTELMKMSNTECAQNIYEVLSVMHFEANLGGEVVVDEEEVK
jgi:5'-deoxynucleotidase YfbR-like HD superfamily hydrolase